MVLLLAMPPRLDTTIGYVQVARHDNYALSLLYSIVTKYRNVTTNHRIDRISGVAKFRFIKQPIAISKTDPAIPDTSVYRIAVSLTAIFTR
jgi:predicted choloylglycine hydrolase